MSVSSADRGAGAAVFGAVGGRASLAGRTMIAAIRSQAPAEVAVAASSRSPSRARRVRGRRCCHDQARAPPGSSGPAGGWATVPGCRAYRRPTGTHGHTGRAREGDGSADEGALVPGGQEKPENREVFCSSPFAVRAAAQPFRPGGAARVGPSQAFSPGSYGSTAFYSHCHMWTEVGACGATFLRRVPPGGGFVAPPRKGIRVTGGEPAVQTPGPLPGGGPGGGPPAASRPRREKPAGSA